MRQLSHRPQPWCASIQTRSPTANSSTVSQGHNGSCPLVPGRKGAIGESERKMSVVDLEIAPTGPAHGHFHQDLTRTELRHGAIDDADVTRAKEYSRTHGLRNGVLLYTSRGYQR